MEPDDLREESVDPGSEDAGSTGKPTQATHLVSLAERAGVSLFHDDLGNSWGQVRVRDHCEHWPCRSKMFKKWLAYIFWRYEGKAPSADTTNAAVNVLEARARFDGPEFCLHNRVAAKDGNLWYDLSDSGWRAVCVASTGWSIEKEPPILFRRFAHQRPQVLPQGGGDLHRLLDFFNVRDERHQLLLLVYVVSCLVPEIPHPMPILYGPQGAAKTTLMRVLRRLVDPSLTETLTAPKDISNLVQQMAHNWMVFYDNLTSVPGWLSDALCRAVTGDGFSKRELYTNDDDFIFHFRRCCGLNGINIAASRPDLLDRALLFGLESIPKHQRRQEKQMWAAFERARPMLVGAAFDALSRAMQILPSVDVRELDRMADFTVWGCAIAEALGHTRGEFLEALDRNFRDRNEEIIISNPVATAITSFMSHRDEWRGSASELLGQLDRVAADLKLDKRSALWPKGPNSLSQRVNEVESNLAAVGIRVSRGRSGRERFLSLIHCNDAVAAHGPSVDGSSPTSSPASSHEKERDSGVNDDGDDDDDVSANSRASAEHGAVSDMGSESSGNTVTTVTTTEKRRISAFFGDGLGDDPGDDQGVQPADSAKVAGRRSRGREGFDL